MPPTPSARPGALGFDPLPFTAPTLTEQVVTDLATAILAALPERTLDPGVRLVKTNLRLMIAEGLTETSVHVHAVDIRESAPVGSAS